LATAWALGTPHEVIRSIAPKSVTTPITIGVSGQIGGIPELTAVLVVLTGIIAVLFLSCGA
jgi:putative effector of murein hydrolase